MAYMVTRFNNSFRTMEALSINGEEFTLHADKAAKFDHLRDALNRAALFPGTVVGAADYVLDVLGAKVEG